MTNEPENVSDELQHEEGKMGDRKPFRLYGPQYALHAEFLKWHANLALTYMGAIQVLESENQNKISLSSHGIREIFEKLPEYTDVPIYPGARQRMGDLVGRLKVHWSRLIATTTWPGDPKWEGSIDNELRRYLNENETFFSKNEEISLSRKEIARQVFRKHGNSDVPLPTDMEDQKIANWSYLKDYFTRTAHGSGSQETEFRASLGQFEQLIFNLLRPQMAKNHQEIDRIIEEGEADAN